MARTFRSGPLFLLVAALVLAGPGCVDHEAQFLGEALLVGDSAAEGKADALGERLFYAAVESTVPVDGPEHLGITTIARASAEAVEVSTERLVIGRAGSEEVVELFVEPTGMDPSTEIAFLLQAREAASSPDDGWETIAFDLTGESPLATRMAGNEVSLAEEVGRLATARIDWTHCEIAFESDQTGGQRLEAVAPGLCEVDLELAIVPFPLPASLDDVIAGERFDYRLEVRRTRPR